MRLTEQQLADLKAARLRHPEFAASIDQIREAFPGSKLTYIKIDELEVGDKPLDGIQPYISGVVKKAPKPTTVGQKRRGLNKYKGDR